MLVYLFFGLGDYILYAKSGLGRILPFLLLFAAIPFTLYKTLLLFFEKKDATKYTPFIILILGPGFGIWCNYLSEKDFKSNGEVIHGKVIKRVWSSVKNRGYWAITAEFEYNSKKYMTFPEDDKSNKFRLNDKIRVRFSTRNPENSEIIDLK